MQNFPTNIRRLLFFHHKSAREASRAIGVSERAVSGWIGAKRMPSLSTLMKVSALYEVDVRALTGDPLDFAQVLADRERITTAERNMAELQIRKATAEAGETEPRVSQAIAEARMRLVERSDRKRSQGEESEV